MLSFRVAVDATVIYEEVIKMVDRSGCSFCNRSEWGIPERDDSGPDILEHLRWRHRKGSGEHARCYVSAELEERFQRVFSHTTE